MTRRVFVVGLGVSAAIAAALTREGCSVVEASEPVRKSRALPIETFKAQECEAYERDSTPREVAHLRREMLARERSNRHMLKKGGRR